MNLPPEIAYLVIKQYKFRTELKYRTIIRQHYRIMRCCGKTKLVDASQYVRGDFVTKCGDVRSSCCVRTLCRNFSKLSLLNMIELTRCDFGRKEYSNIIQYNAQLSRGYLRKYAAMRRAKLRNPLDVPIWLYQYRDKVVVCIENKKTIIMYFMVSYRLCSECSPTLTTNTFSFWAL